MGWTFTTPGNVHLGIPFCPTPQPERPIHVIVEGGHSALVPEVDSSKIEVGRITVGPWGVKLQVFNQSLTVLPNQAGGADPRTAQYELRPGDAGHSESIFLRHGDVILASEVDAGLFCKWDNAEVQVNSSAAADTVDARNSETAQGVAETSDEETADENEDVDKTMTAVEAAQGKSQQPRATPRLSNQASVVQETPTAARVNGNLDVNTLAAGLALNESNSPPITPLVEDPEQASTEQYSTAHTGGTQHNSESPSDAVTAQPSANEPIENDSAPHRHPRVVVPMSKKRSSPSLEALEEETEEPPNKRIKGDDDADINGNGTQDSLSSNKVEPRPNMSSRRQTKRKSVEFEDAATPTSQPSTTATDATSHYDGPTPRVILSNSSLTLASQSVRFLKKKGGSVVESLKSSFNILCTRDGSLPKTAKVLRALASGVPIVTDKWLLDSAKAGVFLPVQDYRPHVAKQEVEWRFKLEDVIGQPQKVFDGLSIHFTPSLQSQYSSFAEIEQVLEAAGAVKVASTKKINKVSKHLVLAAGDGDEDAEKLMQEGTSCYNRDIIPMSIFRGRLVLEDDEFKIKEGGTMTKPTKTTKKKARKS